MAKERVRGVLESGLVSVGARAPDFELPALIGGVRKNFRMAENRGTTMVLSFCPFNWQEATVSQMTAYQSHRARVLSSNAETVVITVESIMNMTAVERAHGPFDFPLCSDFWPHGAVCRSYGVLRESGPGVGASERAIVLVNPAGLVAFRKNYNMDERPSLDDVFLLLERM
jgi:peroxiredoxin